MRQGDATEHTRAANRAVSDQLDFGDETDFEDARRGLIAPLPDDGVIRSDSGRVVWDLSRFGFVTDAASPDTVNPSLWRQTQLLAIGGLFEVCEGVYQVRSADLSNVTFIEGERGVIVVDPLISKETAAAALALYLEHRGPRPVVAVIHTHSHVDHFGGVRGVISEEDVAEGRVKVIAPAGFTEAAIAENVLAGNAMTRRATYMYGNLLPNDPSGVISPGLGLATSTGTVTFLPPSHEVSLPVEQMEIDGVELVFMLAPDTEAPAEMLFHLPQLRALCSAEDATHTLHNLYTLRGARTRDARKWAFYLDKAVELFGDETELVFAQHHWPTWGHDRAIEFLEAQRDAYLFLHDQTLRLANQGHTMVEIAEMLEWPEGIGRRWYNRGYYGSVNHNAKAVYNLYLGFFDGNPAHLHPHPPVESALRYVDYMGGADAVLAKARQSYEAGDYRWVAEVVNHVVFADPANDAARALCADALEQLGYQSENGVWRNFYLTGARELRTGRPSGPVPDVQSPDVLFAMPLEMLFDFMGVRLDAAKADGREIVCNLDFTDLEPWVLWVHNSVLHHAAGQRRPDADVTLRMAERTFRELLGSPGQFSDRLAAGDIVIEGRGEALGELLALLDTFDPWFAIVEP